MWNFIVRVFLFSVLIYFKPRPIGNSVEEIPFLVIYCFFVWNTFKIFFSVCFPTSFELDEPKYHCNHWHCLHCSAVTKSPLKLYSKPTLNSPKYFLTVLKFIFGISLIPECCYFPNFCYFLKPTQQYKSFIKRNLNLISS